MINKKGQVVVPFEYDFIGHTYEDLVKVVKEGTWDLYSRIETPLGYNNVIMIRGKHGFINKHGHSVVSCKYDFARHFSEGLAAVIPDLMGNHMNDFLVGKYGFVNNVGDEVISPVYNSVSNFSNGFAVYQREGVNEYGYLSPKGEEVTRPLFAEAKNFVNGFALVRQGYHWDSRWGFIDRTFKTVIEFKYREAHSFNIYGFAYVEKENGMATWIDVNGIEYCDD
jgi:hypothetical protein